MRIWAITTAAAITATLIANAPTARADDQGYLAELSGDGVPIITSQAQMVGGAYTACGALRNGMSPQMAAQQWGMLNNWGPAIVAAAQHNICPDTLH